jgi:hypothetical protein
MTPPDPAPMTELDGAMHSVWLHGDWFWLTRHMTTPEKDAAADAVERYARSAHDPDDGEWEPIPSLRWWRNTPDNPGDRAAHNTRRRASLPKGHPHAQ